MHIIRARQIIAEAEDVRKMDYEDLKLEFERMFATQVERTPELLARRGLLAKELDARNLMYKQQAAARAAEIDVKLDAWERRVIDALSVVEKSKGRGRNAVPGVNISVQDINAVAKSVRRLGSKFTRDDLIRGWRGRPDYTDDQRLANAAIHKLIKAGLFRDTRDYRGTLERIVEI